jgi:hypothetical protein
MNLFCGKLNLSTFTGVFILLANGVLHFKSRLQPENEALTPVRKER